MSKTSGFAVGRFLVGLVVSLLSSAALIAAGCSHDDASVDGSLPDGGTIDANVQDDAAAGADLSVQPQIAIVSAYEAGKMSATAFCPGGALLTGGGCECASTVLTKNAPSKTQAQAWDCVCTSNGVTAYALCKSY